MQDVRVLDQKHGNGWSMYNGDCVEVTKGIPDNSVGLQVFSPPFSNLYMYSSSQRDMGNCADDEEFFEHYNFLVPELYRILRPGRLCCVHCKDIVQYAGTSGRAGLRDFPGELIRVHQKHGFMLHSRVAIWKDPVLEMQRTKAHGLLYKQLRKDSTFSRQGLSEYVLVFRKWAKEGEEIEPVTHIEQDFPLDQWQKWASPAWTTNEGEEENAKFLMESLPVWRHVEQTNVLNVQQARDADDEKHICPLQLDLIERCVRLWSNPGDVVFSPFGGIGSEPVTAVKCGRKAIAIELKPQYFKVALKNLDASNRQLGLFESVAPPAKSEPAQLELSAPATTKPKKSRSKKSQAQIDGEAKAAADNKLAETIGDAAFDWCRDDDDERETP